MSAGILNAIAEVFPGNPDFICHFHFLRDIGKDLFGDEYDTIRQRLRKHGITTIEDLFAEIEINKLRQELRKAQQNPERIPAKIKRIINEPQSPEKLANILRKSEFPSKSNRILRP